MYKKLLKVILFTAFSLFMSLSFANNFQSVGRKADDAVITSKVKFLYTQSKMLSPFDIKVTTQQGKVALQGMLDTDVQFENAVMLVESVEGVKDLETDNLKVKDSKQPLKDTLITAKIKGKIIKNKLFANKDLIVWPVKVETKNGVVYISGKVNNAQQKENISKLAHSVNGVSSVKSTIIVSTQGESDE